jgi:hypothetical protein
LRAQRACGKAGNGSRIEAAAQAYADLPERPEPARYGLPENVAKRLLVFRVRFQL